MKKIILLILLLLPSVVFAQRSNRQYKAKAYQFNLASKDSLIAGDTDISYVFIDSSSNRAWLWNGESHDFSMIDFDSLDVLSMVGGIVSDSLEALLAQAISDTVNNQITIWLGDSLHFYYYVFEDSVINTITESFSVTHKDSVVKTARDSFIVTHKDSVRFMLQETLDVYVPDTAGVAGYADSAGVAGYVDSAGVAGTATTILGNVPVAQITDLADSLIGDNVTLSTLGLATYITLQQMQDIYHSSGWIDGGLITNYNGGDTSITVTAGSGYIRKLDSTLVTLYAIDWEGVVNISLPGSTWVYVYVDVNTDDPIVETSITDPTLTEHHTNIILGAVFKEETRIHIVASVKQTVADHAGQMIHRLKHVNPMTNESGGVVTEEGTRGLAVSSGDWWVGLNSFSLPAFTTATTDSFDVFYQNGSGGWKVEPRQKQLSNLLYDDGSGTLATLGTARYGIFWVYQIGDEGSGEIYVLYGRGSYTLTQAQDADPPTNVPPALSVMNTSKLLAKAIIFKNGTNFTQILNFGESLVTVSSGVNQLNDLSDVNVTGATQGQFITFDGAFWINSSNIDSINIVGIPKPFRYFDTTGFTSFRDYYPGIEDTISIDTRWDTTATGNPHLTMEFFYGGTAEVEQILDGMTPPISVAVGFVGLDSVVFDAMTVTISDSAYFDFDLMVFSDNGGASTFVSVDSVAGRSSKDTWTHYSLTGLSEITRYSSFVLRPRAYLSHESSYVYFRRIIFYWKVGS